MKTTPRIALWGGIECTLNRVRHTYFDQLQMTGHYQRIDDLDKVAALGIKTLRYPVLWEKHAPSENTAVDWSGSDKRMQQLRTLGITPIVGLLHHGSGPAYATFDTPQFPAAFARYAAAVARRYPWVTYYTPINEPLTTSRFAGLYGTWFPHAQNDRSFLNILFNSCKATVLAMQAIRQVSPQAKLVQTEDLGKTYSTPALQYQANFDNHRRWLAFDLLCGKVNQQHVLWDYCRTSGMTEGELLFFVDNPCPPDIIGLDHYHSSQRFLDERLEHYPVHLHGGNAREVYADVEALRVKFNGPDTPEMLLREVWDRYHLPMAITEVHLNAPAEEQLKWLHTMWETAHTLAAQGIPVVAVTSWALFGSYGWDQLATTDNGHYEAGAFDVRNGQPASTPLADMLAALATNGHFRHTFENGWWESEQRFLYVHT